MLILREASNLVPDLVGKSTKRSKLTNALSDPAITADMKSVMISQSDSLDWVGVYHLSESSRPFCKSSVISKGSLLGLRTSNCHQPNRGVLGKITTEHVKDLPIRRLEVVTDNLNWLEIRF